MDTLKVSARSNPSATAGAIANGIRESGATSLQVVGPRAVNQAVKAIAIARGYLATSGVDLYFTPEFATILIGDQEKTAILFSIRPRYPLPRDQEPREQE